FLSSLCQSPHPPFLVIPPSASETYSLSLHDALPIFHRLLDERCNPARIFLLRNVTAGERTNRPAARFGTLPALVHLRALFGRLADRKSTRLNSSHVKISYAVFCLKEKTRIP